jgi:hypothetical protein
MLLHWLGKIWSATWSNVYGVNTLFRISAAETKVQELMCTKAGPDTDYRGSQARRCTRLSEDNEREFFTCFWVTGQHDVEWRARRRRVATATCAFLGMA